MNAIKVFFARDGSVVYKEQSAVFQRSDLDNWIYAYLPLSQTQVLETLVRLNFERPDGVKPRTRHMSLTSGNPIVRDGVSYYEYSYPLTDYQLLRSGTLLCALSVKQSDSVLMSGTFGIEVGVSLENVPDSEVVDENELESIILVNNRQDVDIANLQEQSEHNEQLVRQAQNAANLAKISAQESETSAKEAAASAHTAQMEVADVKQSFEDFTEQAERDRQSFETRITNRQNDYETQVNERIGEFENDTTARVDELAQQIGERQGTTVDVGGAAVNRIAFASDPQTQIDEKVSFREEQELSIRDKRIACDNIDALYVYNVTESRRASVFVMDETIQRTDPNKAVMQFPELVFYAYTGTARMFITTDRGSAAICLIKNGNSYSVTVVKVFGDIGNVYGSGTSVFQMASAAAHWTYSIRCANCYISENGKEIDRLPDGATLLPAIDLFDQVAGKVNKSGDTMSGKLTMEAGAEVYNGANDTFIEIGRTGKTGIEFHSQSAPSTVLDYDASIEAQIAESSTELGSAKLKYLARGHDFFGAMRSDGNPIVAIRSVAIGVVECPSGQYTTIDYPNGFTMNTDGFRALYGYVVYCPMATYEDDTESSVSVAVSESPSKRYPVCFGSNGQDVGAAAFQLTNTGLIVYNYTGSPIYIKKIIFYGESAE